MSISILINEDTNVVMKINDDNMVNATLLCKATKKQFNSYRILKMTEKEIKNLSEKLKIDKNKFIKSNATCAWIHVSLLKHFSNWISGYICEQVCEQIEKLNLNYSENDIKEFILKLKDGSNVNISIRKNNYVNVTQICKYTNKRLDYWKRTPSNIELLEKIDDSIIEYFDGSYAHPDITIAIAKWCYPDFEVQIKNVFKNIINIIIQHENLKINDIEIISRKEDGYINLNQLCKAGNKEFYHWKENIKSKAFLEALSSTLGIPRDNLLKQNLGGNNYRNTFGHPQIAINIAQWISPEFAVRVSKWIFELLITGKVELNKEKSNKDLEDIYIKKIDQMQLSIKSISKENSILKKEVVHLGKLHDSILKKRNYYKFKKGPCLYIVKDDWRNLDYFKFGITLNINERLQEYRTIVPECKIVYLENNKLLEDCIKLKYHGSLTHNNHEYIIDVKLDELILSLKKLIKFLKLKTTTDDTLQLYNDPYKVENLIIKDKSEIDEDEVDFVFESDCEAEDECDYEDAVKDEDENVDEVDEEVEEELIKIIQSKNITQYSCELCNKKYKNNANLLKHLEKEHSKIVIKDDSTECTICNKTYSTKNKLKRHIDTIHKKIGIVECELCNVKLCSADSLATHIKNVHEKINIVECPECNKEFSCNGSLTMHIKQVHEKSLTTYCEECDKTFTSKVGLENHIKCIHEKSSEKKTCEICNKILNSKSYKYHMFQVHKS